ncbi:hypothetical protein NIES2104_19010 [Leptolyngbya sp. NIES-2104]|nr:hypothetical protein NIES2104_19010 [Leptolyngbya sp. NIES-2104]
MVFPKFSTGYPQVADFFSTPFPHRIESFPQGIGLGSSFFGGLWKSQTIQ